MWAASLLTIKRRNIMRILGAALDKDLLRPHMTEPETPTDLILVSVTIYMVLVMDSLRIDVFFLLFFVFG